MAALQIRIALDARHLSRQMGDLAWLLQYVPKRRARMFYRKFFSLLARDGVYQLLSDKRLPTGDTGDCVFWLRIRGLDELIAAAFRAAKLRGNPDFGHQGSPGVDEDGVGAPDSTFGGNRAVGGSSLVHVASHRTRPAQP